MASIADPDVLIQKQAAIDDVINKILADLRKLNSEKCSMNRVRVQREFTAVEFSEFSAVKNEIDKLITGLKQKLDAPVDLKGAVACKAANISTIDLKKKQSSVVGSLKALKKNAIDVIAAYKKKMASKNQEPCPDIPQPNTIENCLRWQFSPRPPNPNPLVDFFTDPPCKDQESLKAYLDFMGPNPKSSPLIDQLTVHLADLHKFLDDKNTDLTNQISRLKSLENCGASDNK
jgi:hypothetical protein